MSVNERHSWRPGRWAAIAMAIALGTALLAIAACGGSGGGEAADEPEFQRIDPSGGVYTIDDFLAAGFKKSKEYNVQGLSEAQSAWKGFWGPDPSSRTDYELRFYPSHEAAVEAGAPIADEATGEEFKLKKDSQTWTEGAKDRWRRGDVTGGLGGVVGAGPGPIYGDFAVFGNVVMLCEGMDSAQSLERCEGLVLALREASTD